MAGRDVEFEQSIDMVGRDWDLVTYAICLSQDLSAAINGVLPQGLIRYARPK